MQVNYTGKSISSIRVNIKSDDIKTKNGMKRYQNMMKFFTEKFMDLQLNNAEDIINFAHNKNIEIEPLIISHYGGTAMCSGSYISGKINMKPYINFNCNDFLVGWTFETGLFADVDIYLDYDNLLCILKDCHNSHEVFILWLFENIEKNFYNDNFNVPNYPVKVNMCGKFRVTITSLDYEKKFEMLNSVVEMVVNRNKSKRIDTILAEGITIKDYINKYHIYKYAHSENDIFKMMLLYGKPYSQVKNFLKNFNSSF